jgi:hypothetical protein
MKSRTIYVGTRRDKRGDEQEDEEDGRISASMASLQSSVLKKKKQTAVLISGSNQVLIVVFLISATNKVLYRRLHDVRDAASTPGLMSFDPASVDVVDRNFCPLRRCPASFLGAMAMLYPNKQEKCN